MGDGSDSEHANPRINEAVVSSKQLALYRNKEIRNKKCQMPNAPCRKRASSESGYTSYARVKHVTSVTPDHKCG